jgi:hypothetical protein
MSLKPVGYFGTAVGERTTNGLVVNLSSVPPGPLPFHVHVEPALSILIAGQAADRSRGTACQQALLTAVYHPTSEPHANEIGPGGAVACNLGISRPWLAAHHLAEAELGAYQVLPSSVAARLACLRLLGKALQPGARADADLETLTRVTQTILDGDAFTSADYAQVSIVQDPRRTQRYNPRSDLAQSQTT